MDLLVATPCTRFFRMTDLYAVLGLSPKATNEEIKAAYWTLAKRLHPDVNTVAEDRIKEINGAYETLGNPELRAAYDVELAYERSEARRAFWTSAGTGAATFVLMLSCVSVLVMWTPNVPLHLVHRQATASPAEPVIGAPFAEAAVAPPQAVAQRDVVTYAATPQHGSHQMRAPTVEEATRASAGRNARRKIARVGSFHNVAAGRFYPSRPVRSMRGNSQALQKEPRLASRRVTAWQWPSADEPFIELGRRNR